MRTIRNERDYEKAIARLRELVGSVAGSPEAAEFDRLDGLIETYEARQFEPVGKPSTADMIRFRMDQMGLTQAGVTRLTGISKSRMSDLCNGKRPPTKGECRKLHKHLNVELEHLLGVEGDAAKDVVFSEPVIAGISWRVFNVRPFSVSWSNACSLEVPVHLLKDCNAECMERLARTV